MVVHIEHMNSEHLAEELRRVVGAHLDLSKYRLFFFGSRVAGKGDDRSDIDVGIEGTEPISYAIMNAIEEGVEDLKTLYSIDIVDFKSVSKGFYDVASRARVFF